MNIKKYWIPFLGVVLSAQSTSGQVIYSETFPYPEGMTGNQPISTTGWANDVIAQFTRLYQSVAPDGTVYAYSGAATTEAFYTSTTLDNGDFGQAFASIDPTAYPFGVTLSVDLQNGFSPDEVRSRFAVQINGANWYVSRNALPVPTTANGPFANYSIPFLPAASNWNNLTVTGTGVTAAPGAAAEIGGPATSPLTGNITGAGVVVTYGEGGLPITGGGTHNIDNFQIRESSKPGDVNLDTLIDLADLEIIRTNFRQTVGSVTDGDLTSDGFVDFDDFRLWRDNYVPPPGIDVSLGVPEPAGGVLAALALAATFWTRRSVRQRR
jgi:hypothetical protein